MPSYRASNIFGTAVSMVTAVNPTAEQRNAFFGVQGVESLFGGQRGKQTLVKGLLIAPNAATLKTYELLFESYFDGIAGPLVDNFGYTYLYVKLQSFTPKGQVRQAANGAFFRPYEAVFDHLL